MPMVLSGRGFIVGCSRDYRTACPSSRQGCASVGIRATRFCGAPKLAITRSTSLRSGGPGAASLCRDTRCWRHARSVAASTLLKLATVAWVQPCIWPSVSRSRRAIGVFGKLGAHGIHVDPLARIRDLSHPEKQMIEVIANLDRKAGVLFLDEQHATLRPKQLATYRSTIFAN